MHSFESLKELLKDQYKIIIDLNISIKNMLRLEEELHEDEELIKRHGFFQHYWYQLKFVIIIQLAKLYSIRVKQDRRSFKKLIKVLESSYDKSIEKFLHSNAENFETAQKAHPDQPKMNSNDFNSAYGEWLVTKKEVDRYRPLAKSRKDILSFVNEAKSKLELPEIDKLIQKVLTARDKVYAHKDPNPNVEYISPTELKQLIDLANDIYNSINLKLFGAQVLFTYVDDWKIEYVLKRLSVLRQKVKEEAKNKKNSPPSND